jgi:hypothetical protein
MHLVCRQGSRARVPVQDCVEVDKSRNQERRRRSKAAGASTAVRQGEPSSLKALRLLCSGGRDRSAAMLGLPGA